MTVFNSTAKGRHARALPFSTFSRGNLRQRKREFAIPRLRGPGKNIRLAANIGEPARPSYDRFQLHGKGQTRYVSALCRGAGNGNRTRDRSLGSSYFTTKLFPHKINSVSEIYLILLYFVRFDKRLSSLFAARIVKLAYYFVYRTYVGESFRIFLYYVLNH